MKPRILSVLSPLLSAVDNTAVSYSHPNAKEILKSALEFTEKQIQSLSQSCQSIVATQAISSSRISEILALTTFSILSYDTVLVKGSKRSASYTIYLPDLSRQVSEENDKKTEKKIFELTYKQVYTELKKAGCRYQDGRSRNCSCTHHCRYVQAKRVNEMSNEAAAGDLLHHRSKTSILYYLKQKEVPNGTT